MSIVGASMGQHRLVCRGYSMVDDEYEIYFTSETGFFIFNFHDCEHLGIFNGYIINKSTSNKIIKSIKQKFRYSTIANEIFCSA